MTTPLRQRRRAVAIREILDAAGAQIAADGPAGLALRSVARSLGMTVQGLNHYFPSRDELITALITEAYRDLADAAEAALDASAQAVRGDRPHRFVVAAEAYRDWAVANAARFHLIYGTPLPRYEAPVDGGTTDGARRLGGIFIRELFAGFDRDRLAGVDMAPLSDAARAALENLPAGALGGAPAPAAALFVSVWGHVHGLVMLESFGHTAFIGPAQPEVFRAAVRNLLADAHRRIPR